MGCTADYIVYCAVRTHVNELGNLDNCNEYFSEHEEKDEYEEELHKHGGYNFFPKTIFAELSGQDNGFSPKCNSYG